MKKSNHEIKIDQSWERLQETIRNAENAYNNTVTALQELGKKGIKKVWIGTNVGLDQFVTEHSVYTHVDTGIGNDCQHDILSRIGVGMGCSNGANKTYQTQIHRDSLVYGIYELSEEGWKRLENY